MQLEDFYNTWYIEMDDMNKSDVSYICLGHFLIKDHAISTAKEISTLLPTNTVKVIKQSRIRVIYKNGQVVSEFNEQPYSTIIGDW